MPSLPFWQQQQNSKLQELYQQGERYGYVLCPDAELQCHIVERLEGATLQWSKMPSDDILEAWHDAIPWQDLSNEYVGLSALFNWDRHSMYSFLEREFGEDPNILEAIERGFLEVAESIPM